MKMVRVAGEMVFNDRPTDLYHLTTVGFDSASHLSAHFIFFVSASLGFENILSHQDLHFLVTKETCCDFTL